MKLEIIYTCSGTNGHAAIATIPCNGAYMVYHDPYAEITTTDRRYARYTTRGMDDARALAQMVCGCVEEESKS